MPTNTADPEVLENRVTGRATIKNLDDTVLDPRLVAMDFQTYAGGGVTVADQVRDRGVGENYSHAVPGPSDVAQITMSRTYRAGRDADIVALLKPRVGRIYGTAAKIVRDLNQDEQVKETYTVLLEGVTGPDGDTNGNGKGQLTLMFGVVAF